MRKTILMGLAVLVVFTQIATAHDPRTTAKDFSHSMMVEGAGKLTISYKSLHFNEQGYSNRKTERALTAFNRVWKSIGKFESEFDVVIAGVQVPKGSYGLGINFDANDNYKLLLSSGGKEIAIPLKTATETSVVGYLSFDVRPENDTDTFTFEGRYGPLRVMGDVKVPYLADHSHEKKN